jgi:hypothetical protein
MQDQRSNNDPHGASAAKSSGHRLGEEYEEADKGGYDDEEEYYDETAN